MKSRKGTRKRTQRRDRKRRRKGRRRRRRSLKLRLKRKKLLKRLKKKMPIRKRYRSRYSVVKMCKQIHKRKKLKRLSKGVKIKVNGDMLPLHTHMVTRELSKTKLTWLRLLITIKLNIRLKISRRNHLKIVDALKQSTQLDISPHRSKMKICWKIRKNLLTVLSHLWSRKMWGH